VPSLAPPLKHRVVGLAAACKRALDRCELLAVVPLKNDRRQVPDRADHKNRDGDIAEKTRPASP
jgi:hypothetical protein